MDVTTYAAVTDVCLRLAGRLSDDVLDTVRLEVRVPRLRELGCAVAE